MQALFGGGNVTESDNRLSLISKTEGFGGSACAHDHSWARVPSVGPGNQEVQGGTGHCGCYYMALCIGCYHTICEKGDD
jgi:hypothetical protein